MLDLISIGDVTEDVFLELGAPAEVERHHKNGPYEICIPFGTKIAIRRVDKLQGGNAGNAAIGARRLGLRSALYTEVGDDVQGNIIYRTLQRENVSTRYFLRKKGEKTNYSVVLNYQGERTILVHHEPRHYDFPALEPAKWIYFTSLAKGCEKIFSPLLCYLSKTKAHLAFNPGTHQINLGLSRLKPLLSVTTVLCLNTEEAQTLLRISQRDLPLLLRKLHQCGPTIVVITAGPNGSYCFDGSGYWYCPIYKVPVLEMTGSGDSFAIGFLSALLYHQSVPEALRWGSINAALVIQRIGPQAGLIRVSLLKKILSANQHFHARSFTGKEVTAHTVHTPKHYRTF